jgi:hypothetical protein
MVSYSDEFKINQNILWIVFFELGIILSFFLAVGRKPKSYHLTLRKLIPQVLFLNRYLY